VLRHVAEVQVNLVGKTYGFFAQVYFFPFVVILAPAFEQDWPLVTAFAGATAIVAAAKSPRVEISIALRNIKTSVGA
jgi:hypothetical protein